MEPLPFSTDDLAHKQLWVVKQIELDGVSVVNPRAEKLWELMRWLRTVAVRDNTISSQRGRIRKLQRSVEIERLARTKWEAKARGLKPPPL